MFFILIISIGHYFVRTIQELKTGLEAEASSDQLELLIRKYSNFIRRLSSLELFEYVSHFYIEEIPSNSRLAISGDQNYGVYVNSGLSLSEESERAAP